MCTIVPHWSTKFSCGFYADKDARLTLRLTSDTKAALQAQADARDRSINWLAQHIFDTWLARQAKPAKR